MSSATRAPFSRLPRPAQWALLITLSLALSAVLEWAGLPAALLIGPMIAGILMETGGGSLRVNPKAFNFAQAVIGCQIARGITPDIVRGLSQHGLLFFAVVGATVLASCLLGWAMGRLRIIPGTTAVWGLLPGGASVMMLMAEAYGADARLVAFMQYVRVVVVTLLAALVAHYWAHVSGFGQHNVAWLALPHWVPLVQTLALIVGGVYLGRLSRLPAGMLLLPMIVGAILHLNGWLQIELPPVLLALAYMGLGWNIGLRFTRGVLAAAARALPQTLGAIFTIVLFCAGLAWLLVLFAGVDPLTAYLATSPGGIDTVAIIAASATAAKVDVSFVMSVQAMRLVFILIAGPPMSRFFARNLKYGHPEIPGDAHPETHIGTRLPEHARTDPGAPAGPAAGATDTHSGPGARKD